ncbi:lanthionine synthetase C family protein [Chitinophaga filiformis]|uniref:lanthionine synthetase C family protein n=1 Tax=Chitinophaga filiformis TaxID=104663 RepID=UPI001F17E84C|nr:lanthionine synthetase C family protein [Chitinophaga filiformis]MCF6406644.1 lanthionine synthetase C family protein [Chitinophaga filiformis]
MNDKRTAGKILQDISQSLDHFTKETAISGLLGGYTGAALFFAYYYQFTGKQKYLKKAHQLLERGVHDMAATALPFNYCNGIAGIVWNIQHLIKAGFVNEEGMDDIFEDVDEILGQAMLDAVQQGQHDFLHQGLGIALYFLERDQHPQAKHYLTTLVSTLESTAMETEDGISWQDHLTGLGGKPPGEVTFNMGLAHGVPAVISILGMIYQKGIAVAQTDDLIRKGISWLLKAENSPEEGLTALYPVLTDVSHQALTGKQSRLGWCYGDLGIATTLLNAGIWLADNTYQEKALQIFHHTLAHRNIKNSNVHDACLCHGSAGIAHIYRRAWLQTKDPALLTGATYWLQEALQMNTHKDSPGGFRFYAKDGYENSYGILEGVAGIGLALMAAIDEDTDPSWDRCMLLC